MSAALVVAGAGCVVAGVFLLFGLGATLLAVGAALVGAGLFLVPVPAAPRPADVVEPSTVRRFDGVVRQ